MTNQFTDKEKAFFQKFKKDRFYIYGPLIGIVFIIFVGLLFDIFDGFSLFKESKSIFHWVVGLFLFGTFYLLAEGCATWTNKKDSVSDPLFKRLYHLIFLLGTLAFLGFVWWLIYRYVWQLVSSQYR